MRAFAIASAISFVAPCLCWGGFGHEITATIAQMHLLPSTHDAICNILPATFKCQLAGVASWPDLIKQDIDQRRYSGLHFVNAANDTPPFLCDFGSKGWLSKENILQGIVDTTRQVLSSDRPNERDRALRFLIHFLGDIHQPFHLTGRDQGANLINVSYNGQTTKLHALWDDTLINHMVLHMPNYTSSLSTAPALSTSAIQLTRNDSIEFALRGSIYDPYIRWIVLEGIYNWWAKDLKDWTTCPQFSSGVASGQTLLNQAPFEDPVDLPVCPFHWAVPTHELLCGFIWPEDVTAKGPVKEMNGTEYAGRVRDEKIVEKQLAMGGLRLAATLNGILGSKEDKLRYGVVPFLS